MAHPPAPLQTSYADRFRCIGGACEDTCCTGWKVDIDRATFAKYQALDPSPLRLLLDRRIAANPQSTSDRDFAQVALSPSGECPFLSPQKLCSIQLEHGAAALSPTCAEYPRTASIIDGHTETSLQLSCPEAARLVLLDKDFLRPKPSEDDPREEYLGLAASAASLPAADGNPLQYLGSVRHFTLLVIRDRSYPLWQRLFIVGLFCKKLAACRPRHRAIPQLVQSYGEIMAQAQLRAVVEQVPRRTYAQLTLLLALWRSRFGLPVLPPRFRECLDDCRQGLDDSAAAGSTEIAIRYAQAHDYPFNPFLEHHGYMLENYLVSSLVRQCFPYGEQRHLPLPNPASEFALLALHFSLIRGMLIGMAAHYRQNFAPEHVVKLVQSFVKTVEHSAAARKTLAETIRAHNLTTPDAFAMMLRI